MRRASGAHDARAHAHARHRTSTRTTTITRHAPAPDYSRQIALREVGAEGQARLRAASVLVVGAGGLGVPVLQYLAGAGVGRLGIVDADRLEPSNLHRQTWYALRRLRPARNPRSRPSACARSIPKCASKRMRCASMPATPSGCAAGHDLILDCSDNFATKFLLNDLALRTGKPVLFASVYQYEGQLQLVRGDDATRLPALRVARGDARRARRQLRRGRRARPGARRVRQPAGARSAEAVARPAGPRRQTKC